MARDLDDLATEQVIARICGRKVEPLPNVPAAWLLAGDAAKRPDAPDGPYAVPPGRLRGDSDTGRHQ